jgi:hypothetical protein
LSDEEWIALGALDDEAYFSRFEEVFGVDLRKS